MGWIFDAWFLAVYLGPYLLGVLTGGLIVWFKLSGRRTSKTPGSSSLSSRELRRPDTLRGTAGGLGEVTSGRAREEGAA